MTEQRMALWFNEFGAAYAVPPEITDVLEDLSYGNDACPSFTTRELAQNDSDYHAGVDVRLWVDHPDPAQREAGPTSLRFRVSHFFGETEFLYETETDIAEALAVLRREAAKYTQPADERRLRYSVTVGNIGTVYQTADRGIADEWFDEYADQSRKGYGRAASEPVTLCDHGEPVREFRPTFTPPWVTADGEYRLTIAALRDLAERAASVIRESDPDASSFDGGHGEILVELQTLVSLCDDAAMTAGELTLPGK